MYVSIFCCCKHCWGNGCLPMSTLHLPASFFFKVDVIVTEGCQLLYFSLCVCEWVPLQLPECFPEAGCQCICSQLSGPETRMSTYFYSYLPTGVCKTSSWTVSISLPVCADRMHPDLTGVCKTSSWTVPISLPVCADRMHPDLTGVCGKNNPYFPYKCVRTECILISPPVCADRKHPITPPVCADRMLPYLPTSVCRRNASHLPTGVCRQNAPHLPTGVCRHNASHLPTGVRRHNASHLPTGVRSTYIPDEL